MTDIFEIRKEHAKLFSEMDPYGLSKLSGMGNIHSFVATQPFVKGDYPIGICTAYFEEKDVYVLWLYIRSEYRAMGIGEGIFEKICSLAGESGEYRLHVLLPKMTDKEAYASNLEYYFRAKGFESSALLIPEFWLSADRLYDFSEKDDKGQINVKPLKVLSAKQIEGLATVMDMKCALPFGETKYDKSASCVCFDKQGKPTAGLLLTEVNGTWLLAGSFSEGAAAAEQALEYALSDIAGRMKIKDAIYMLDPGEEFAKAAIRLLSDIEAGYRQDLTYCYSL